MYSSWTGFPRKEMRGSRRAFLRESVRVQPPLPAPNRGEGRQRQTSTRFSIERDDLWQPRSSEHRTAAAGPPERVGTASSRQERAQPADRRPPTDEGWRASQRSCPQRNGGHRRTATPRHRAEDPGPRSTREVTWQNFGHALTLHPRLGAVHWVRQWPSDSRPECTRKRPRGEAHLCAETGDRDVGAGSLLAER